ncbi:hypothetical protein GDO86_003443 [Hymenochirus boettgeri]|uniref:XK-related protein n=1 Tax=Hymenochirus boettgeri TaxID=247094 RepID=A0A8T2K1F0_9PIPI|nr:hypothetical protein GDO86_003443 [Hymenochirus boettgeri]
MPSCWPPRYRLLDLLLALGGTLTFLVDLSSDVWGAVEYYRAGDVAYAACLLAFYGLSSAVLQLHSWSWFWADRHHSDIWKCPHHRTGNSTESLPRWDRGSVSSQLGEGGSAGTGLSVKVHGRNGKTNGCSDVSYPGAHSQTHGRTQRDAQCTDPAGGNANSCTGAMAGDTVHPTHGASVATTQEPVPPSTGSMATANPGNRAVVGKWGTTTEKEESANVVTEIISLQTEGDDTEQLLQHFSTSRHLFSPPCLVLLHFLQLGYLLRCIHSLEVGVSAYRSSEQSPTYVQYQDYAYFLTHDISMMRLIETFLENTPQLILLLYVVLRKGTIYAFQYFSICISFISISWAILDYHQSLRLFLKEKKKLNIFSSVIYFLWNFLFIFSRIVCITLFSLVFHSWISLHFSLLWLTFFLWASWQQTDFMKNRILEQFYRATVAVIMYFSWFNISDGRSIYRCLFYYVFVTIDCAILFMSWQIFKFPSSLDEYETYILFVVVLAFLAGLSLRMLYYIYFHPNRASWGKKEYDEPDAIPVGASEYRFLNIKYATHKNPRMLNLSRHAY